MVWQMALLGGASFGKRNHVPEEKHGASEENPAASDNAWKTNEISWLGVEGRSGTLVV